MAGAGDIRRWADEDPVRAKTLEEATAAGASLYHEGGGGLDPGLALHVFRRDGWACRLCGSQVDIEIDHLDGHPGITPALPDYDHADIAENLATVCRPCDDALHTADRKIRDA